MQMRASKKISDNYIFRLGILHTVFVFLKVMGKYVTGSGLDKTLLLTRIYGPTTHNQILDGEPMKRAVEAHTIIYLALYKLYNGKKCLTVVGNKEETALKEFTDVVQEVRKCGVFDIVNKFDESLQQQALFLRNYMKMFESLLLFIRASRGRDWKLHLTSLDNVVKYFFAHDQINYARMVPLYLATMDDLSKNDIRTLNYLKENLSNSKTEIPFTIIGSDHSLEQENKVMKVTGGVVGLTQNPTALHRFCLVLSSITKLLRQ